MLFRSGSGRDKAPTPQRTQGERFRAVWPELRDMILPRRRLLATGLALFGTLVHVVSARMLDLEVDRALADRARVVIAQVTVSRTASGLEVQLPDVDAIAAGGAVVQVTGFDGTIVRSALLGRATLPLSEAARQIGRAHV